MPIDNLHQCLNFINNVNHQNEKFLNDFFVNTFERFLKQEKDVFVYINEERIAHYYLMNLGVIAPDCPGILETISGYLHNLGFNLIFVHGFLFPYKAEQKTFILYRLQLNEQECQKFQIQRIYLKSIIERASHQSGPINYLIAQEIEKLEIYEEVIRLIHQKCDPEIAQTMTQEKGEIIKFFTNRTRAYICERTANDLFTQIYNNFIFTKKLLEDPQVGFYYRIENLKTTREKLTGISVISLEEKINMNMILTALRKSIPHFMIRYVKKYMAGAITVIRLEINDHNESWYNSDNIRRIENAFETLRSHGYLLSLESFDKMSGFEQYGRAIIPILRNEAERTGIAQFYLSLENRQEYFIEYKAIIVYQKNLIQSRNFAFQFALDLSQIPGFHIFKISPPSRMNDNEMDILDLRIETEQWDTSAAIYNQIKLILNRYLPHFRDFDEGMRLMDLSRLNYLKEKLSNQQVDLLSHFYYHLNEFYRISAFPDEVLIIMDRSITLFQELSRNKIPYKVVAEQLSVVLSSKKIVTPGSIFYICYKLQHEKMVEILKVLSSYEVIFSRVDFENTTILIAIVKEKHTALNAIVFQNVKHALETIFV